MGSALAMGTDTELLPLNQRVSSGTHPKKSPKLQKSNIRVNMFVVVRLYKGGKNGKDLNSQE